MSKPDEILLNDLVLSVKKINDIEKLENIISKGIDKSKAILDSTLISHLQYIINTYFQNFNPDDMSYKYLSTLLCFIKAISEGIDDIYNWDLTKHEYALLLESCLRSARIYLKVNPKRFSFLLHIVCDTAQVLASRSIIMKNALIKEMSVLLIKLVLHPSVLIHEKLYLLKILLLLLRKSDKTLRADLCWEVRRYLCRLVDCLHTIGDFTAQCDCVEVIFRYSAGVTEVRNKIASFFRNPELEKEFLSIPTNGFEIGCRKFLNNLNKMEGSRASVLTLACLHVFMGQIEVFKPTDLDYTDFWIDVNIGMERITFVCDPNALQVKGGAVISSWEFIVINSQDVEEYELLPDVIDFDNAEVIQLKIWLRNVCKYQLKTSMDIIQKTKVITFHIKRADFMAELKNNVFPTMFGKSLEGIKVSRTEGKKIHKLQSKRAKYKSRLMNSIAKKANISYKKTEGHSKAPYSNVKTGNEEVNKEIVISLPQVDGTQLTNSADSIKEMYRKLSAHQNVKYAARPGCKKEPELSQVLEIQDSQILNLKIQLKDKNISETVISHDNTFYDNSLGNEINETRHKIINHCTKEECEMRETNISQERKTVSKNKLQCILDDWNQSLIEETLSINAREVPETQQQNKTEGKAYSDKVEQKSGIFCNKSEKISLVPTSMYSHPIFSNNNGNNACKTNVIDKKGLKHSKKCKSHLKRSSRGCRNSELKGSSIDENEKDGEFLKKVRNLCIRDGSLKESKEHTHNDRILASSLSKTLPKTEDVHKEVDAKKIQHPVDNVSSDAQNKKSLDIMCESVSSKGNYKIPIVVLNNLKCSRDQNMNNNQNIPLMNSRELNKDLVVSHGSKHKETHLLCTDIDYHNVQQPLDSELQLPQQSFQITETGATPTFSISEIESQIDGQTNKYSEFGDIKYKTSHSTKPHFMNSNEMSGKNNFVHGNSMNNAEVLNKEDLSLQKLSKDMSVIEAEIKSNQVYNFNQVFDSAVNKFPISEENLNNRSDSLSTNVAEVKGALGTETKKHNYEHLDSDNSSSFDFIFPNSSTKIKDIFKFSEQKVFKTTKTVESVITLSGRKVIAQRKQKKGQAPATKRKLFSLNEELLNENSKNGITEQKRSKAMPTTKFSKQRNMQKQNSSRTFKKPSVSNRNSVHKKKERNETFESKLSVFSDFNSEDEVIPDFLQKVVKPTKKKPSKKKQKYSSMNMQKEKELELVSYSSSDENFKKRKFVKQKVKSHKAEERFKTEMHKLKRMEQKKPLKNTSEINNQSNISISINSTGNSQIDEFDKLLCTKRESENLVFQNTNNNSINYKCANELKQQNNSCFRNNNLSTKVPVKEEKHIQTNNIISRIKLKKDQNVTQFGKKSQKKISNEENLSDSSCNSNHPRCQPLSKVMRKNLLQMHKEKSLDFKSINNPSSNSLNELKSPLFSTNYEDSSSKNISDSKGQKNKKQKLMLLEENKDCSDNFDFTDSSIKSVCNTRQFDKMFTKSEYINETNKHALVKNMVTKLQNPVESIPICKKRSKNSRILKDITNLVNVKQFGSHCDQIDQNIKKMFEKISQNSSTPKPNISNICFTVGTNISSIHQIGKGIEKTKNESHDLNVNVKDKHYTTNNSSTFDLSNISHMSILSSSNMTVKNKDEQSISSLGTCISFISDDLIAEKNSNEGKNIERKLYSTTKFNHHNILQHNKENDNFIKIKVKNSSSKKKSPLLENNCNAFQKKSLAKCYKNEKNKIGSCENEEIHIKSTTKKHKKSICQLKTQTANKLDIVSQMRYGNKISEISNVVVSQTNTKCEDWCSGIKNNDSLTSRSLSDETDNGLAAENISIASELQNTVSFHLKNKFKLAENFSTHVLTVLQNNLENMELNDEEIWKSSIHKYKQQIDIQLNDAAKTMESIEQQMSDLKNVENLVKQISESLEPKFQLALEKIQLLHQTNKNMVEELSSLNKASLKPINQLEATMEYFRSVIEETIAQQSVNALATIRSTVSKMLYFE